MPATAGKKTRVKVATTVGGTYDYVLGCDTATLSIEGTNIDVSEFGVDYVQRIQGLKDFKISLSGNLIMTDTTGQLRIRSALLNDTDLFARFLPDDAVTANAGIQGQVKPANWQTGPQVAGKIPWSVDLEGTGAVTLV